MRIKQLKPYYFRAFGDKKPIRFSDNLTIFFGNNGTGKSSLAEAIEWLFFGYTKRRRKGDSYSKNEYRGCYVHKGCPRGISPYVEADILLDNGEIHTLKRLMPLDNNKYPIDDKSIIYFDNQEVNSYYDKGIHYSESHCPVIVQHGIQDFIHTQPIERYRAISEALGLSELIGFKDILERAKNNFKNNPPYEVNFAREALRKQKNFRGNILIRHSFKMV